MVFSPLDPREPQPISDISDDDGNSTIYRVNTPPESVVTDLRPDHPSFAGPSHSTSSVPWPNSTFIIRSASSGGVITLIDGQVLLAPPGGRGSIHWACVETKGWLGFRNTVSGKYLGHDDHGKLRCSAGQHMLWEWFCVRAKPEGGFVLFLTHWERLWQVGLVEERGVMAKVGGDDGIVWEFVKI